MIAGMEAGSPPKSPREQIIAFGEKVFGTPIESGRWRIEEGDCEDWDYAVTDGTRFFIPDFAGNGFREVFFNKYGPSGMSTEGFTSIEDDTPMFYFN